MQIYSSSQPYVTYGVDLPALFRALSRTVMVDLRPFPLNKATASISVCVYVYAL
jgi:hypothetical protein